MIPIYTFNFKFFCWPFCILLILLHCIMKSHVASATNAVIICITIFSFYIFIESCVLDLSSFELKEHNKMTLNKVPYNEHRAQGPCHCGPQNSLFFGGALLVNYGKITVLQNTQLFNQLISYIQLHTDKDLCSPNI